MTLALHLDATLLGVWSSVVPGAAPLGLAGAVAPGRGAVVAVFAGQARPAQRDLDSAAAALAVALGVSRVDLVTVSGTDLIALIRQWAHQAAQGSGRGVSVLLPEAGADTGDGAGASGILQVVVKAIDSSARELSMRLSSPNEPALAALSALLGRPVRVADGEAADPLDPRPPPDPR